ncbi:MAG: NAD(P)-binding domain-containing protein, partial [Chloroflexota bacterium]|nr:NAD(P)-binding domain-containing protein [Chloroflexota bacterium]
MKHVDLLIIGAGPAGLSTGLHLLKINPDWASSMLVIEKATHPRDKLCGGGLTPLGVDTLKKLDFSFPLPLPQVPVHSAKFVYKGCSFQIKGSPRFIVFNRIEFDHYLVQTARERGVRIHENEAVQTIEVSHDGVTVTTTRGIYHAKAVVGADGATGITRRMLRRNQPQKKTTPARVARSLEVRIPAIPKSILFSKG